jgi:hypothetical protein
MPRYDFVSPGAMAGNAIEDFLLRRELENRQRMLDELTRQQQDSDISLRTRAQGLDEAQFTRRTTIEDADRAETQRTTADQANVRDMVATAMTQGVTPDVARNIGITAYREGMAPPPEVTQMQDAEQAAQARSAGLADYESRAMIDASVDAQAPKDQWRPSGAGPIFHAGTGEFRQAPQGDGRAAGAGEATQTAGSLYSVERRTRIRDAVTDILPHVSNMTVGAASYLGAVRGTPQRDFQAAADYLKSNIGFSELTEMREASKTGGALGQVSNIELQLLTSALGSLDVGQSPEAFKRQLQNIMDSLDRWERAKQQFGAPTPDATSDDALLDEFLGGGQ